jgi:hypothetical protein
MMCHVPGLEEEMVVGLSCLTKVLLHSASLPIITQLLSLPHVILSRVLSPEILSAFGPEGDDTLFRVNILCYTILSLF